MTLVSFPALEEVDEYYATLAETWLGVPVGDLLPASPPPEVSRILSCPTRRETRSESVRRSVCIDMKLTVQTFLTLDGVMQAPGGPEEDPSDAFTHGGWQAPFPDPAVGEFVTELNSHASAFLFGRRTFDIFRGHWPDQTDPANPIATAINSLPKYVVSNSLSEADATWRGEHPDTARLVTGDVVAAVQALKDEPGDSCRSGGAATAPDAVAARARRPLPPDDVSAGARLRSPLVQRGHAPGDDAPRRPHRDRSRHRPRHLRTSRSGSPRSDVTGWGWP